MNKKAVSCAKKLCGMGTCIGGFNCGHTNHINGFLSPVEGGSDICPLEKYNVEPEENSKAWHDRPYSDTNPSSEELDAICEECEYSCATEFSDINEWMENMATCFNCPVKICEDQFSETETESAVS